jgi:hypothetical protein
MVARTLSKLLAMVGADRKRRLITGLSALVGEAMRKKWYGEQAISGQAGSSLRPCAMLVSYRRDSRWLSMF